MNSENTTVLVPSPPARPAQASPLNLQLNGLADVVQLGGILAQSGMFDTCRTAAQAVVKILTGAELGFGPMASLIDVHFFDGKPTVGAHLRAAAIKQSAKYDYDVVRSDRVACEVRFWERVTAQGGDTRKGTAGWVARGSVVMTLLEACETGVAMAKDGKSLKNNWARTPDDMLFARVISKGYRRYCPDLTGGVLAYDPDELDAGEAPALPPPQTAAGEIIDAGYTVNHADGSQTHVGDRETTRTPGPQEALFPNLQPPATTPAIDELTEGEYEALVGLAREHKRTQGQVSAICAAAGVPVLRKTPRARLDFVRTALIQGLVSTEQKDRITALVTELGLDWNQVIARVQTLFGASSVAHLLPGQAQQIEDGLSKAKAARQQQGQQAAA